MQMEDGRPRPSGAGRCLTGETPILHRTYLLYERESVRDKMGKHVGIQHHNNSADLTQPALLAAHMSTGSIPSCCEVIRCKLPNSALDDVSLPVSATPSQPRNVPKNGYAQPVRVNARPSTASSPEYRVTYPSPSMNEIAITARRMRTSVCQKTFPIRTGDKPSNSPQIMAARKQPAPAAVSQSRS